MSLLGGGRARTDERCLYLAIRAGYAIFLDKRAEEAQLGVCVTGGGSRGAEHRAQIKEWHYHMVGCHLGPWHDAEMGSRIGASRIATCDADS